MKNRLSWNHIREHFSGHWVELVECEWNWSSPWPTLARVRHVAADRGELMRQIEASPAVDESIVVYVGGIAALVDRGEHAVTC